MKKRFPDGRSAQHPYRSNRIEISLDKATNPGMAAGLTAHETKHYLQKVTARSYRLHGIQYELEAYGWQRAADKSFKVDDAQILDALMNHPAYSAIRR